MNQHLTWQVPDSLSNWMLCKNNQLPKSYVEPKKVDQPSKFYFNLKKFGRKGQIIYCPEGYGRIEEEQNSKGKVYIKLGKEVKKFDEKDI